MQVQVITKLAKTTDDAGALATEGQRLRHARAIAGLSGPVLAKELGITRSALSQMELDRIKIPAAQITSLTQLLSTTPDWLKHGLGLPPRWPERPVIVPEMDLDHVSLGTELSNGNSESGWLRYRTQREWALPFSEARRLDINPHRLIAVRVNETIPPEFKPGDFVVLDCAINEFTKPDYYGLIIQRQFMLAAITEADRKSFMVKRGEQRGKSIPNRDVSIVGPIVYCFRRPSILSF